MNNIQQRRTESLTPILIALFIITVVMGLSFSFDVHESAFWLGEGGVVESLSAIGYFLCAFYMLLKGGWSYIKSYGYFFVLVILFGFRELDFHKKFTSMGLLKSKLYVTDTVPLYEKMIGFILIAILIYILFSISRRHGKSFLIKIKQLSPVHLGVLATILLLVVSKLIDGLGRKLKTFGIVLQDQFYIYFRTIEEVLELGISIMIMATLLIFFSGHNNAVSSYGQSRQGPQS
jgi:hypothetical protein